MAHAFESARLEYRQLEPQDWTFYHRLYSNPRVMGFVSEVEPESIIREKFQSRIADWTSSSSEWLSILVSSKESGSSLGIIGFKLDQSDSVAEVGYLFSEEVWGAGYASESLAATISYSKNHLNIVKFIAVVSDGNVGSENLLTKIGFEKDKSIKNAIFLNGKWHDDLIYKYAV